MAVNVIMLLGLGTWLLLAESKSNPHEREYLSLQVAELKFRAKAEKVHATNVEGSALIDVLSQAVEVTEASYKEAVEATGEKLRVAANAVYRRALVNQFGAPDFTSAYLGDSKKIKTERVPE